MYFSLEESVVDDRCCINDELEGTSHIENAPVIEPVITIMITTRNLAFFHCGSLIWMICLHSSRRHQA